MERILGLYLLSCVLTSFMWLDDIYAINVRDVEGKN